MPVSEITQTEIRNALAPIWHTKAATANRALIRLNMCLKHAAALGLDVDLQAVEKARALLGQQLHKTQNIPAMDWKDIIFAFKIVKISNAKTFCQHMLSSKALIDNQKQNTAE